MALVINPRRRAKRARKARRARRARRTVARPRVRATRERRAYTGRTARPLLVKDPRTGIYKRTERSKKLYPDVRIANPRRRRKKNPDVLGGIMSSVMSGLYGVAGIAGVNLITNLAGKFVPFLENKYVKSAVKVVAGVAVPELFARQLGRDNVRTIQTVVVAYVLYDLITSMLPEGIKTYVSALELPETQYEWRALPTVSSLNSIYPEGSAVPEVQYQLN